jgi:hypothetical protein
MPHINIPHAATKKTSHATNTKILHAANTKVSHAPNKRSYMSQLKDHACCSEDSTYHNEDPRYSQ